MVTVLLVDDDADTRANMRVLVEMDGFDVIEAATAAETRKRLLEQPDVVVLDRKLPDGIADRLLLEFGELAPHCEFIVVTGYADFDSAVTAMRNGVADYLLKPIQPELFRSRLCKLIEHRQLSRQLQVEHEFADKVLRTAEAIVLVLDTQGRVQRFNSYLTKLTGWELSDLEGKNWIDYLVPESHRPATWDVFSQTSKGVETRGVVNPVRCRNGQMREIRWSNALLQNHVGQPESILAIGMDVTDFMETQKRMLRAERLATIGQMMAALAHESRNALQRIQASADLLELEVEDNVQAASDVSTIRRAANDLNVLLEEVRSFAAPIHLRKENVLVQQAISQAWHSLQESLKDREVELEVHPERGTPVALDLLRMEQVFRNLFENSLAATPDPVKIRVCIERAEDQLTIVCSDNGPGLNAEQKQNVFEAFYTTNDRGTGLGMAIVQRIIEAHGGLIDVDSSPSPGAHFRITVPVIPQARGNDE